MKRVILASAALLFALPVLSGDMLDASRRSVTATLKLPFEKVLPGVPFDVEVTLTNTSPQTVKVGTMASIVVTRSDGARIPVSRLDRNRLQPYESADDTFIELSPGESTRRVIGWDSASPPNWSITDGFSGPNSYEIALELEIGGHTREADLSNYVGTLRTSTAPLQRVLPLGDDEAIWKRMQEIAGGHWSDDGFTRLKEGKQLAKEIIDVHPASNYYPYALLLFTFVRDPKDIPKFLDAAERFADSPAHAYLLKAAGDAAYGETIRAAMARDNTRVSHFGALAEKYYRAALDTSQLGIKQEAEIGLQRAMAEREKVSKLRE